MLEFGRLILDQVTVERVVGGKWGPCAGQACIAIDYLLVEEEFAPVLVMDLFAKQ